MHSGKTAAIRLDGSFSDTVYEEIMSSAWAFTERPIRSLWAKKPSLRRRFASWKAFTPAAAPMEAM